MRPATILGEVVLSCAAVTAVAQLKGLADFVLRMAFFATAPFLVVFAAELFPVTGAVLQIGLALLVFLLGEAGQRALGRRRWLRAVLRNELAFDAHYRERPPRPFLYYVFYPLLFPYWLTQRDARREFLLYKGYTWPAFALLLVSLAVQYLRVFPPELSLRDFAPIAAGSLLAESIVVLMFLLPLVTTVVHFHHQHAPRRLVVLLLVACISVGYSVVRIEHRRDPIVSYATRTRVRLRSQARPELAAEAQERALAEAARALPREAGALPEDGRVEGLALDQARSALKAFYKEDEAEAFELWYSHHVGALAQGPEAADSGALLTLFFPARRAHQPIWLSLELEAPAPTPTPTPTQERSTVGQPSHDASRLSEKARRVLGVAP